MYCSFKERARERNRVSHLKAPAFTEVFESLVS